MQFLGHNPLVGASIVVSNLLLAAEIPHAELPVIVMQLFQIGAWSVAMVAGAFTIYGVWKTHHGKKSKRNDTTKTNP